NRPVVESRGHSWVGYRGTTYPATAPAVTAAGGSERALPAGSCRRRESGRCYRMTERVEDSVAREPVVPEVVSAALAEDLRYGADVTTQATVGDDASATAALTLREPGVLA